MSYKILFNDYEKAMFDKFTGTENTKVRLMSIMAYIKKYPTLNTKDLYTKYQYKTAEEFRFTRRTFNNCLSKLEELKLISRTKKGLRTFITILNIPVDVPVDVPEDFLELEVSESVENTSLEADNNEHNSKMLIDKFNKIEILNNTLKELGIRSKTVYNKVLSKIENINIDVYGAVEYITKCVENAYKEFQEYRNAIAKLRANKKRESFTNAVGSTYSDVNSDIRAAKNQNFCMMMSRDRSEGNAEGNMDWNTLENLLLYGQE